MVHKKPQTNMHVTCIYMYVKSPVAICTCTGMYV